MTLTKNEQIHSLRVLKALKRRRAEYEAQGYTGYCIHGTYVGGCGPDWMCGDCENDPFDGSLYREALAYGKAEAHEQERRCRVAFAMVAELPGHGPNAALDRDLKVIRTALLMWAKGGDRGLYEYLDKEA